MKDFGPYVIISKPQLPYRTIAELSVKHSVRMLQLREKHLSDRELLAIARELRGITKGTDTLLVINDRVDLAALCEADVLHLGQDDLPMSEARRIVGKTMKIGLSTHNLDQVHEALLQKPDYIGFGPVFPTNAKAKPDPVVGAQMLRQVIAMADVPVVAIGGIFEHNLQEVLDAGAKSVALVRHLMQTQEFETRLMALQQRFR